MNKYIAIIISSLLLVSCEDIIDLDLKTAESKLVIEGNIYNHSGPYTVRLSKTVGFNEPSIYPTVSGALVIIADNHGIIDTLTETSAGIYKTSKIEGIIGYTYYLTVVAEGNEHLAQSTMHQSVEIDSLYFKEFSFGPVKGTQLNINFMDPQGSDNYYHLISYINGSRYSSSIVSPDIFNDGESIEIPFLVFEDDSDDLVLGDNITVELQSVDENVYDYFRTSVSDDGLSSAPANPLSNISNGALGYFNACAINVRSIVFQ